MIWSRGTRPRHLLRTCKVCGHPTPPDAIRLRGGRFYCPLGECRRAAEEFIRGAQERLEPPPGDPGLTPLRFGPVPTGGIPIPETAE